MSSGKGSKKSSKTGGDSGGTKTGTKASPPARYPWEDIEDSFINGIATSEDGMEREYLNLKETAERFGVPYQRVKERSARYRWTEQRHAARTKLMQEQQKQRIQRLAKDAIDFDEDALKIAKIGMALTTTRLGEIADQVRSGKARRDEALERLKNGDAVEKHELYSAIYHAELESLARAAGTFQEIGRRALGTDIDKHEISGPGGGPLEIGDAVSVASEMLRDDPTRLAAIVSALERTKALPTQYDQPEDEEADEDVEEAEWEDAED